MPKQPKSRKSAAATAAARQQADEEEVPSSPATVLSVDFTSPQGKHYDGKFKYKVPTLGERVDISVLKAQYLQQVDNVSMEGTQLADMLAYLAITVELNDATPAWWKESKQGIDLYDYQPVVALYTEARSYEARFLGGDKTAGGTEESNGNGSDDAGDGNVDGSVQPTAERRKII
jgi:hypothetical protein